MDLNRLLDRADWMKNQCGEHTPPARNPGLVLGAVIGESAIEGRDKLTVLSDAPLSAFAGWIEQIIAESSGKNGKGSFLFRWNQLGCQCVWGGSSVCLPAAEGELDENIKPA
jgi:glucose-6-phosphate isomerase